MSEFPHYTGAQLIVNKAGVWESCPLDSVFDFEAFCFHFLSVFFLCVCVVVVVVVVVGLC